MEEFALHTCSVRLLGALALTDPTGRECTPSGRKLRAMLVYLSANVGKSLSREHLATLLWGDRSDAQARQSLRESLSRVRRLIDDVQGEVLISTRDSVSLSGDGIAVDLRDFEYHLQHASPAALATAVDSYRGPFVDGFVSGEDAFDEWLVAQRSQLHERACSALVQLCAYHEARDELDVAEARAMRLLELDPSREEAHQTLMRLYAQAGRQSAALRQYQACADSLRLRFDAEPDSETRRLRDEIVAVSQASPALSSTQSPALEQESTSVALASASPFAKRLKIAVLPFTGMTGDGDGDYFVNGITEDIVTALTRNRWLSVIGHNMTMTHKGQPEHMLRAAHELGARYVVEGSVRKAGQRVRISARLVDTQSGAHLWSERYDRELEDIFAVQDEITTTIAGVIEPALSSHESQRAQYKPTNNLDAWDCYYLGLSAMYRFTQDENLKAQTYFERAIALDPQFAIAYARLGYAKVMSIVYFEAAPTQELLDDALRLSQRATQLDDLDAVAHFALGRAHLIRGEYDESVAEFETAIELNPCLAHTHCGLGDTLAYRGDPDASRQHFDTAMKLSPHDPYRWAFLMYGSMAYLFLHRHEEAADWAGAASRVPNSHYWATAALVAALGHLERPQDARAATGKLLELNPRFSCAFARERLFYIRERSQLDHYIDGLRAAGIPELSA
jgi:TolB-like protein/Tfp pilus assembly protein PilF